MNIMSKFQKNAFSYYKLLQEQYSAKYLKEIMIGLTLAVVLSGGYVLNMLYVNGREERAFVALSEVIESFMHAQKMTQGLDDDKDQEKIQQAWQDTQLLLDALYKEHKGSKLSPYFLAYKSQVLLETEHNLPEALKILDTALAQMSSKSDMKSLFTMKRIKMGFNIESEREKSLSDLIVLSNDSSNVMYQEALYLLGIYFLHIGDSVKSQEAFKTLAATAGTDMLIPSPWVKQAQEKIISHAPSF